MNILIVGGNGMQVDDGSAYWTLKATLESQGHTVRLRECLETGTGANKITLVDLLWADGIVCYSYGCASVKALWHDAAQSWPAGKKYLRWVIVAGVPDAWMEQFYGSLWHKPLFVDVATNFQVDAIPASCELQDVAWATFAQMNPDSLRERDYVINCNALVDTLDPVSKHTHIENDPRLLATIGTLFGAA